MAYVTCGGFVEKGEKGQGEGRQWSPGVNLPKGNGPKFRQRPVIHDLILKYTLNILQKYYFIDFSFNRSDYMANTVVWQSTQSMILLPGRRGSWQTIENNPWI